MLVVQLNRVGCGPPLNALFHMGPSAAHMCCGSQTLAIGTSADSSSTARMLRVRKGAITHDPQLLLSRYVALKVRPAEPRVRI